MSLIQLLFIKNMSNQKDQNIVPSPDSGKNVTNLPQEEKKKLPIWEEHHRCLYGPKIAFLVIDLFKIYTLFLNMSINPRINKHIQKDVMSLIKMTRVTNLINKGVLF